MSVILSAENVYKTYHAVSGDVHALNGVSISFEAGLFYAIVGRSGSGKSTLLHILGGLDRPTSGRVILNGQDIYACSDQQRAIYRRRFMGFVFQQFNLLEEYTVLNNICMPLKLDGKKPDPQFLAQVTELLGIGDKLKKYPSELSGGEQQRVAIARSVLAKPQLVFADEPTGNLDRETGAATVQLLRDSAKAFGQTLIVVTHDAEIADLADRAIQIEDGRAVVAVD
ncbi:MAG: ABC transporter ATP-binding protein [Oscillospiraceae bacterium]|nr:ABC transporter ATP-binding protein [Oscillospiraceae bacterium]